MAKKRVGIVALVNWECNFGNRLQNYALQTIVERLGFDVETINDCRFQPSEVAWKRFIKDVLHRISHFRYDPFLHHQRMHFWIWVKRHRKVSPFEMYDENEYPGIADRYDYFITGSDQIWRPIFPATSNAENFLQFAPGYKRIAYAPSFGMKLKDFPQNKVELYKERLSSEWKALSVREVEGANIIKELTGKEVPVLLDPTMLLTTKEWDKVTKCKILPKHYLLICCLRTNEYKEWAEAYAKEHNLKIIDIMGDERYVGCDPGDFVTYIKHADHILTNSFHCNVFAFLYHRPVTYYLSNDEQTRFITSRIDTLMELVGQKVPLVEDYTTYPDFDWNVYERNLHEKRENAINYLKNALDCNE